MIIFAAAAGLQAAVARPGAGNMTPRKGIIMRILLLLLALCGLPAFADQTPLVTDLTSTLTAAEQMSTHLPESGGDIFDALADHLLAEPKLTLPCFTFTLLMMVIIVALYRFGCSKTIIAVISLVTMSMWSFVLREDVIMRQVGNFSFSLLIFMPLLSRLRNIFVYGRIIIAEISDAVKGKKKSARAGKKSHASSPTSDLIEEPKNRRKIAVIVLVIVVTLISLALCLGTEWLANAASRFAEFILTVLAIVVIVLSGGFKSGGSGGSSSSGSFRGGGGSSGGGGASGRW